MLEKNFYPYQNKDYPSGNLRFCFVFRSEFVSDKDAESRNDKGRAAYNRYRRPDVGIQKRKGYSDRQRVDTCRNRHQEKLFDVEFAVVFVFFSASYGFPNHFAADKQEKSESYPVVKVGYVLFELRSEKPADKRH